MRKLRKIAAPLHTCGSAVSKQFTLTKKAKADKPQEPGFQAKLQWLDLVPGWVKSAASILSLAEEGVQWQCLLGFLCQDEGRLDAPIGFF